MTHSPSLIDLEKHARDAHDALARVVGRLKPGQVRNGLVASAVDLRAAQADIAAVLGWLADGAPAAPSSRKEPVR